VEDGRGGGHQGDDKRRPDRAPGALTTASIQDGVDALRRGTLVILPTETVYGLGADAADPRAVAAIFEAKGRPRFNPLIAHVADRAGAERLVQFDDRARLLAEAFWPGPLTIIAPLADAALVCELARAGLNTVAVRAPAHPLARRVLEGFGGAVVAPSANRSGRPSPTTFADAVAETGASAAAALDGGPCAVGLESTVVALLDGTARLLRPGAVTRAQLEPLIGPLAEAEADAKRSPGRLAHHYAPDAPVRINALEAAPGEIMIGFAAVEGDLTLSAAGDLHEAAANLFAFLRAADARHPSAIVVAPIPDVGVGEAINDRLRRAAGFVG